MLPLSLPIWLAGLWYLFFPPRRQNVPRALPGAWTHRRDHHHRHESAHLLSFSPPYPLLFAAGAVAWERWLTAPRPAVDQAGLRNAHDPDGRPTRAPTLLPLLPPETYISLRRGHPPPAAPHRKPTPLGPLPPNSSPINSGWPEMGRPTSPAHSTLFRPTSSQRPASSAKTMAKGRRPSISTARKDGLPPAISGHQKLFPLGPPRGCTGEKASWLLAGRQKNLEQTYTTVRKVAHVEHPYSMPYEHFDVFLLRASEDPPSAKRGPA